MDTKRTKDSPGWVAHWLEHCPVHQKVQVQFPDEARTYVGVRTAVRVCMGGSRPMFLTSMLLSLSLPLSLCVSLSLPVSLKIN